ncbi:MAG: hypothetical protein K1X31_12095 [Gemmatimonadaceae bacterium]|nr:hypothetical protein [Gemmatimonadaceae bacterium]
MSGMPGQVPADVPLEAAVLRAALHAGLTHEAAVARWAAERLLHASAPLAALADVAYAPEELTAQREALRPLAAAPEREARERLAREVRQWAAADLHHGARPIAGALRILSDLRREGWLDGETTDRVKRLEDRAMQASVAMPGVTAPTVEDLRAAIVPDEDAAAFLARAGSATDGTAFLWRLTHGA